MSRKPLSASGCPRVSLLSIHARSASTALVASLLTTHADGASAAWDGSSDTLWSNAANWTPVTVPGATHTATFNAAPGIGGAVVTTGTITLRNLIFDTANAGAYVIGGAAVGTGQITIESSGAVTLNAAVANDQLIHANLKLGPTAATSTHTFTNNSAAHTLTFAGNLEGGGPTGTPSAKTITATGSGVTAINGNISNGSASQINITKTGTGQLTLGGNNTTTGTTTVSAGSLKLTGALTASNAAGSVSINPASGVTSTMNIDGGSILVGAAGTGNTFVVGGTTGGTGILNMSSGSLTTGGAAAFREVHVGRAGFGVANISGGTATVGGFLVGGIATSGAAGIWNISGGSVSVATNGNFGATLGATAGTTGVMNVTGNGTFNSLATGTSGGIYVGEAGTGTLNVSGTGQVNAGGAATSANLVIGRNNVATAVGIVNLGSFGSGGGTITTNRVWQPGVLATSYLNFHGGTLRSGSTPNAAFLTGLLGVYVYGDGGKFDTNGQNITVSQDLLAPAGDGVSAINHLAAGFTGSGYTAAPLVTITGGDGVGATAVATIDASGNLTGITVTNPGTDFTSAPTVTLSGGGFSGTSSSTVAATLSANASGGLTKLGAGTLTLDGFNSYGGPTTLAGGKLSTTSISEGGIVSGIGASGSEAANLVFDGGILSYGGGSSSSNRGFTIQPGKTAGIEITDAGAMLTISGSSGASTGGFTKSGPGGLVLGGDHGYTGATSVTTGLLHIGDGAVFGTSTVDIASGATLSTAAGSTLAATTVSVASGGLLVGEGSLAAATTTVAAGGRIAPGDSFGSGGVLTTGSLVLTAGSIADFEIDGTVSGTDRIDVATAGGLHFGGTAVRLFSPGTTLPVTTNGTFPIFGYNALWTGSLANLTIDNPVAGKTYVFSDNTATDRIQIAIGSAPSSQWNLNGGGTWGTAGNWSAGVPNALSALASFVQPASAGSVAVSLNVPATLGSMKFASTTPYTITPSGGNSITFNNGAIPSLIEVTLGNHQVNAPLTLVGGLRITAETSSALALGGNISGGQALSTFGTGTVTLGGTNSFSSIAAGPGTLVLGGSQTFPTLAVSQGTVVLAGSNNYTDAAVSGTGTLVVGNSATSGSLGAGSVVLADTSVLSFDRDDDTTVANPITGTAAAVNKLGTGALTLSAAASNVAAPLNITEGTLRVGGTYQTGTTSLVTVGTAIDKNAKLAVAAGGSLTAAKTTVPSLVAGGVAGAAGSVRNEGGTLTTASELWLGNQIGSFGAMTLTGGVTTTGSFLVVANSGDTGVLNASGTAAVVVSTNFMTLGAGTNTSYGVANFSGSSSYSTTAANGSLVVGEFGTGILTVSGNASVSTGTTGTGIEFGRGASASTGIVNLRGGTITTNRVAKSTVNGVASFNFNGGTLKANTTNASFMPAQTGYTNFIQSGGAVVDTNGFNIGITSPLLAPVEGGVSATGLTVSGGGFIDTPAVIVSGGDGTGATAVATINDATGQLTGIQITNPGSGYTTPPSFALVGGGEGNTGSVGGTATLVTNAGGGLTKVGVGNLTLGGVNTYTGVTTVGNHASTDASRLVVSNGSALGSTAGGSVVNGQNVGTTGTILQLATGVTVTGETLTLATGSAGQRSSLYVGGPADVAAWNGDVTLSGAGRAQLYSDGSGASSLTVGGTVTGSAGEGLVLRGGSVAAATGRLNGVLTLGSTPLSKTDSGTWILGAAGNVFGSTTIAQGTLRMGISNALPASTVVTLGQAGSSATLDLDGTSQAVAGLLDVASATAPTVTSATAATLTINHAGPINFGSNGGVLTGAVALVKAGAGVLTLSGANTYTGDTTVAAGTLQVPTAFLANSASVRLTTGSVLNLGFAVGTPDTVHALYIDGIQQDGGTWGSLASSATHKTGLITGTGILQVTTSGDKYGSWVGGYPALVTANDKLPDTDFDRDGFVNLLEFVLGGDPSISSQAIQPTRTLSATHLTLTFKRSDDSESPVTTQTVEVSGDLTNWNSGVIPPVVIGAASSSGPGYSVTVTENGTLADDVVVAITRGTNTDLFARLKVIKP